MNFFSITILALAVSTFYITLHIITFTFITPSFACLGMTSRWSPEKQARKRVDWSNRIIATLHAIVAATASIVFLARVNTDNTKPLFTAIAETPEDDTSLLTEWMWLNSIGYVLYDVVLGYFEPSLMTKPMWIHHFVMGLGLTLELLLNYQPSLAAFLLLSELSTPFLHFRTFFAHWTSVFHPALNDLEKGSTSLIRTDSSSSFASDTSNSTLASESSSSRTPSNETLTNNQFLQVPSRPKKTLSAPCLIRLALSSNAAQPVLKQNNMDVIHSQSFLHRYAFAISQFGLRITSGFFVLSFLIMRTILTPSVLVYHVMYSEGSTFEKSAFTLMSGGLVLLNWYWSYKIFKLVRRRC